MLKEVVEATEVSVKITSRRSAGLPARRVRVVSPKKCSPLKTNICLIRTRQKANSPDSRKAKTTMTTLLKDQFGHLTYDEAKKLIRLNWLPATAKMTADDFKHTLTVAADAVLAHSVEGILVDARDLHPNPAMGEVYAWRVQNIVPKYNQVLKRFAWLGSADMPEMPGGGNAFSSEGETYVNRWFRDEAAAVSWATTNT